MKLKLWAKRWSIPENAFNDLLFIMGVLPQIKIAEVNDKSESAILNLVKLEASRNGVTLWRNNVGAAYTQDGSFIRYGLANESKKMNTVIKSSDLIGIKPILISPNHVGCVIGQFISRETKHAKWFYTGTETEKAQLKWIEFINSKGGDASFATNEGTF